MTIKYPKIFKQIINNLSILTIICTLVGCGQANKLAKTDKAVEDNAPYKIGYSEKLTKMTKVFYPHRIDVQQGNVLTAEMLEKLHIGMNKQQVKLLLGTSLMSESPSKNQWLYIYNNATSGVLQEQQSLILTFNQDGMLDNIREEKVVG